MTSLVHCSVPTLTKALGSHSGIGEDSSLLEYDSSSQDATNDKTHPIISSVFCRFNGLQFLWCYEAG